MFMKSAHLLVSSPLILLTVLAVSCTGAPELGEFPPEWLSQPLEESAAAFFFRGIGGGESIALAKDKAMDSLIDSVIEAMNIGDPERWSEEGRTGVKAFREELKAAIRMPEFIAVDGVALQAKGGWKNSDGGISYAVEILWEKQAFATRAMELAEIAGVASPAFRDLEKRARDAEIDGNVYEAGLIWAAAAGIAQDDGNVSGYRQALREVERVLAGLDYDLASAPTEVYVDIRPAAPVVFRVLSGGKPVGNAEFVVGYPRNAKDGSPDRGDARVISDSEGRIVFRPPGVGFDGTQRVTLAPSADPFLEYLDAGGDSYVDALIASVETPRIDAVYEAQARSRTVPTGILILETDLAGNPLNSTAAAGGLADDLDADGFDVAVMELDPREMMSRSDRALLRDLKADILFSGRYDRVIHGTVSLESFERDGDTYTVRVSGTLSLSDIDRQFAIHRSVITKTSRASDGQQAMSAAFRQLGRSFAGELIDRAP